MSICPVCFQRVLFLKTCFYFTGMRVYLNYMCAWCAPRLEEDTGSLRTLDPLALGLLRVVSCRRDVESSIQVLCKSSKYSELLSPCKVGLLVRACLRNNLVTLHVKTTQVKESCGVSLLMLHKITLQPSIVIFLKRKLRLREAA